MTEGKKESIHTVLGLGSHLSRTTVITKSWSSSPPPYAFCWTSKMFSAPSVRPLSHVVSWKIRGQVAGSVCSQPWSSARRKVAGFALNTGNVRVNNFMIINLSLFSTDPVHCAAHEANKHAPAKIGLGDGDTNHCCSPAAKFVSGYTATHPRRRCRRFANYQLGWPPGSNWVGYPDLVEIVCFVSLMLPSPPSALSSFWVFNATIDIFP